METGWYTSAERRETAWRAADSATPPPSRAEAGTTLTRTEPPGAAPAGKTPPRAKLLRAAFFRAGSARTTPVRRKPERLPSERRGWVLRCVGGVLAAVLAVGLLRTPQTRRTVALVAAGLRQPENAVRLLAERLEEPPETVIPARTTPAQEGGGEKAADSAVSVSESAAAPETPAAPAEDGSGGKIVERKLAAGDTLLHGIAVKNRSGTAVDIAAALRDPLPRKWQNTTEPQVLIVHTHTTEAYMTYDAGYYNAGDRERTADGSRNVCAVGDAVAKALTAGGIGVIHDTTVHDSPQYSGAYTRSAETVTKNLQQYPSIQIVLDLHRDAITDGSTLTKPTVVVNGRKAAQMMIVVGVVSTKALPNANCGQNLALAAQWQRALTAIEPDLMRPLSTVASRYNQNICPGYLLVEVGSEGNTVAEAAYSGELLAQTLLELLR